MGEGYYILAQSMNCSSKHPDSVENGNTFVRELQYYIQHMFRGGGGGGLVARVFFVIFCGCDMLSITIRIIIYIPKH